MNHKFSEIFSPSKLIYFMFLYLARVSCIHEILHLLASTVKTTKSKSSLLFSKTNNLSCLHETEFFFIPFT